MIIGIGNIYVETNYLGLATGGKETLESGKEYRADRWEVRLGGSVVNFVTQAKRLGAEVGLIGKRGEDEQGEKLVQLLHTEGISSELIIASSNVQTSVDTGVVFEHNGNNIQLVAGNANKSLALADIPLDHPNWGKVTAVYLGGFLKQEGLYRDYPKLLQLLFEGGKRLFLDHGRIPVTVSPEQRAILIESLGFVEGYLPNEEELFGMTGKNNIEEALKQAIDYGPKIVVVKLGPHGCRVKTKEEDFTIPGHTVHAISTVGAGDAFNAGFITQHLEGKSLRDSAIFANATAALRVSTNKQPTYQEVYDFVRA
jgi:sugar/nucleoside kinase (ribokinase family)